MKTARATIYFVVFLSLNSCQRTQNRFIIHDKERAVISAEIRSCGKIVPLTKTGNEIIGTMPTSCEGEGNILLRLSDDSETRCRIGYVTPGADQTFDYVVENKHCH